MRKFHVSVMMCFTGYAMAANAVSGGGGGGGGHGGSGGGGHEGSGSHGGGGASHGSAVRSGPATGTHIAGGVGTRTAQFTVVSQREATIDGTARLLVTVKLNAPLTSADKNALRFHGFKQGRQYDSKEPAEVYCPPTQLPVELGNACIRFVYR